MIPTPALLAVLATTLLGTVCTRTPAPMPAVSVFDHDRHAGRHSPVQFEQKYFNQLGSVY